MLIGLDFDNTIVRYDRLFHRLAVERELIPQGLTQSKHAVRDFLRSIGREEEWTELQGIAYGPRIVEAEPFPGVKSFLSRCREVGVQIAIISHKTRHPYRGDSHDLHAAAHAFLEAHGFYQSGETGMTPERVFLELSLPAKLARVESLGCNAFVDDLPEVLLEPSFPRGVRRILFDPAAAYPNESRYERVETWNDCAELLLTGQEALA